MKKILLSSIIFLILCIGFVSADVFINEFVVDPQTDWDNSSTIGYTDEWFELYNPTMDDINITNWNLSLIDSSNESQLLQGIISPNGHLIILNPTGSQNNDGMLILYNTSGAIIDQVTYGNYNDGNTSDNAPDGNADNTSNECLFRLHDGIDTNIDSDDFHKGPCTFNATNNRLPTGEIDNQTTNEDGFDSFNVSSYINDLDNDPLTFTIVDRNISEVDCNIINDTNVTLTPDADWNGVANCTVRVDDTYGTVDKSFNIIVNAVNDAPVLSTVPNPTATEDVNLTLNVTQYISDVDNETSELTVTTDSTYEVANDGQTVIFNYHNGVEEENVTITVSDGSSSDSQNITITVTPVNDAPTINNVPNQNVLEDVDKTLNITPYINDVDNNISSLIITEDSLYVTVNGQVITFNYPDDIKEENVTINVSDGSLTSNQTITVSVQTILSFDDLVVTIDGNDYSATNGAVIGPATPDSTLSLSVDINNNYQSVSEWVETIVLTGRINSVIDDTKSTSLPFTLDGSKSTTKTLVFNNLPLTIDEGSYNLTITANGTDYKGVLREVSWLIYIDYTTENREIKLTEAELTYDNLICYRKTELNVSLVNTGETTQYVNLTISNDDLGIYNSTIILMSAKDEINTTYHIELPNAPNAGTYPINVQIKYDDGEGGYITESRNVDLVINDCFDVQDKIMLEDTSDVLEINLSELVNDPIKDDSYFDYSIEQTNEDLVNCTLSGYIITCVDTKEDDETGSSDITVNVSKDPYYNYDTFTITVTEENDPPVAYGLSYTLNEDNYTIVEFNCSDSDGDSLDYIVVDDPDHGTLSGSGSSRTYTPDEDYNGADFFTYKCNDGAADSNIANVEITVNSVLDEPSIAEVSPDYNPLIGDGVSQEFSITVDDPDDISPTIKWYVDGNLSQTGGTTFSHSANDDFTVKVNITDATTDNEHVWNVDVSSVPVTTYSGTINNVNDSNVNAFSNLTIINSNGKIDFGNQVIDLSNVVDVDRLVKIEGAIVSIDSDVLDMFDIPTTITLSGLTYNQEPVIYFSDEFTTNPDEIITECTSCTLVSFTDYPTGSGTVVFSVTGFSSYKVRTDSEPETPPPAGTGVLQIKDVDVDEDNPKPDEIVEIVVEVENDGDLDIEDIELTIELRDEDGDVVEDEDNDDLEDDIDFDLDEGDEETFEFTFKMPADAKDGDEYTVYVEACGEDDDGVEQCAIDQSETIKIERESHEVQISSAVVSPSTISCYDSFDISVGLKNIGKKDEEVQLTITRNELEISNSQIGELEAYDSDDYKTTISEAFAAPSDLAEGVYTINIRAEYNDEEETETLQLTKAKCKRISVEPEAEEDIIIVEEPVTTTPAPEAIKPRFKDSFEYMILLSILIVLILGLAIFTIGAVIIRNK